MNNTKKEKKPESTELFCPHHNCRLVLREAKSGVNKGQKFWGCPTWGKTGCNYTQPYEINWRKGLPLKEKIRLKLMGKNGKISVLKVIGQILLIPIYLLGLLIGANNKVFREIRKR